MLEPHRDERVTFYFRDEMRQVRACTTAANFRVDHSSESENADVEAKGSMPNAVASALETDFEWDMKQSDGIRSAYTTRQNGKAFRDENESRNWPTGTDPSEAPEVGFELRPENLNTHGELRPVKLFLMEQRGATHRHITLST